MEKEKKNIFKKIFKEEVICALIIGLLLGALIVYFVNPSKAVIKVAGKKVSTNKLYEKMKKHYSISLVLEDVDSLILDKKYKLEEDEINKLKQTADKYIEQYAQYGYDQETFLSENGFEDYDAFVDYLTLDYKRTIYFYDYMETKLEKDAVETYYNENAFGKINNKHILVKTSDDMTEDQALAISKEIISKLDAGEAFDTVAEDYKTKYPDSVVVEELGEIGAFDSIETTYMDALKTLEKGTYTKEPVKTSYGYHVIYCIDKAEKTDKISRSDRMAIINTLAADLESEDTNSYYKALINMRKEAGLKFYDKDLKTQYEKYCTEYTAEE